MLFHGSNPQVDHLSIRPDYGFAGSTKKNRAANSAGFLIREKWIDKDSIITFLKQQATTPKIGSLYLSARV
jgi:hypothetical protein